MKYKHFLLDLLFIENLAVVDRDAEQFLETLAYAATPRMRKFQIKKGLSLSGNYNYLIDRCSNCHKVKRLLFTGLCHQCQTIVTDQKDAHIKYQIIKAKGQQTKVIEKGVATSIPDAYRLLGICAYKSGARIFKCNNLASRMWYETTSGLKYYLRLTNVKTISNLSNHS